MVSPKMISFLTIFLVLPTFLLVNGQATSSGTTNAVIPASPAGKPSSAQQTCINLEEYRSMFASLLSDNSFFSRDLLARTITWTDMFYNMFNKYKWTVDAGLGVLATLSPFLPGGPLIPMIGKVAVGILLNENMRRLIKEITYEVWTMIPASGSEQYAVSKENSMVIVRQVANPAAKLFKRSIEETNWSAIIRSLSDQFADLQREFIALKPFEH